MDTDPGQPGQSGGGEHARRDEQLGADAGQQHDVGQVGADDDRADHGQEGDVDLTRARLFFARLFYAVPMDARLTHADLGGADL